MVKRLIFMQPGARIRKGDIEMTFQVAMSDPARGEGFTTLDQTERTYIMRVLTTTCGVIGGKRGAATLFGMRRSTLQCRIKKN